MSASIQAKKTREEQEQTSRSKEQQAQRGGVANAVANREGPRALTAAASLLVEVYGGLVQNTRSQSFGPDQIFVSFIRNLVSWNTEIGFLFCHFSEDQRPLPMGHA